MAEQQLLNVKFVQEVEKYPCLYNTELPAYTRKDITEAAWDRVGRVMNMEGPVCKDKWRNMRVVFMRHLKQRQKKKPYYLTDAMQFIKPYMNVSLKTTNATSSNEAGTSITNDVTNGAINGNDDVNSEESDDSISEFNQYNPSFLPVNNLKRKRRNETERYFNKKKPEESVQASDQITRSATYDFNPNKCFLLGLLPELDEMNSVQIKMFKRRVLAVIDEIANVPNETENKESYNAYYEEEVEVKNEPS